MASLGGRSLAGPLLLVGSTLLTVGLGEGAVRFLHPQVLVVPLSDYVEGIRTVAPGVSGRHYVPGSFDVRIRTSAQRFRGSREYAPFPPSGVFRIAVLGDSFAFGIGANDSETYPAFLKRRLESCGGDFEVINAGVKGTGTGDQALWYDRWVSKFHPDLVILSILPANDLQDVAERPLFRWVGETRSNVTPVSQRVRSEATEDVGGLQALVRAIPGYEFLAQRSQLLNLVRVRVSMLLSDRLAGAAMGGGDSGGSPARGERENTEEDPGPTHVAELITAQIDWLANRVEEDGGQLVVVILPSATVRFWRASMWDFVSSVRGYGQRANIPTYDLTAPFRQYSADTLEGLYHCCRDRHPNPAGYSLFAELVAEGLLVDLSAELGCPEGG